MLVATADGAAPEAAASSPAASKNQPLSFTGVNLAGGEFNHPEVGKKPHHGVDYFFPTKAEFSYFVSKGVNIIRVPFLWENLQAGLNQPFDQEELARLKTVVAQATNLGLTVILDPHNYDRYYGKIVGGPEVPDSAFANFWGKLAEEFRDNSRVWFGLVNEPHEVSAQQWLTTANAAITAIRGAGAKNLILVPGTAWSGAHSWIDSGNGDALPGIKDPQQHYLLEAHQYLDPNTSGQSPEVLSATIGSERLTLFTQWCREHHQQAFLGEFGAGNTPLGEQAIEDMLRFMENNRDVWTGFTWWAAGAYWGDYIYSIEPKAGADAPFMRWLSPHLAGGLPR